MTRRTKEQRHAFETWINTLVHTERFPTASVLAHEIGMSLSAFSRGVREEGTLSVENCLALARVLGEHPSRVLRLAGRETVAEHIDHLFNNEENTFSEREHDIIRLWRDLTPARQAAIEEVMLGLAG